MTQDIEKLAKQLHEWYLEATDIDGVKYNPEAVVPWDDLPYSSKIIDRYIAEKVLTKLTEEARREERERIVAWAKEQEWDAEEEANDPTKDFIAHDAYESKAEAWFYGYNEALKELLAHLSDK